MPFGEGDQAELELVDLLTKDGFCAVGVPVAGGAASSSLIDY